MTVLLFANGDLPQVGWLRPYLAKATAVIAANGGSGHLYRLGHLPDVVVGDLDSVGDAIKEWIEAADTRVISYPQSKDETDLELALLFAAENFTDEIIVVGAFGGRLDQTLANVLLLMHPQLKGHSVVLMTPFERAWLIDGETAVRGQRGDTVSLIPLGGDVEIDSTYGLQWNLKKETLASGPARGVSNMMIVDEATITVISGQLLCIHTQQSWKR